MWAYALLIDAGALAITVLGLLAAAATWNPAAAWRTAVIVALAVGYSELTARVTVVRQFLHLHRRSGAWSDQSSVWTFAAAVTLPLGWACVVVLAVAAHSYLRSRRHRSLQLYRLAFSRAMTILGVSAAWGVGALLPESRLGGAAVAGVLAAQVIVYTTVSLIPGLLHIYLDQPQRPRRALRSLLPSRHDVVLELAALVVGAVLGRLLLDDVWLAPFAAVLAVIVGRATSAGVVADEARRDGKTGLLTAEAWRELAAARLRAPSVGGAVLMIDLDHFKRVNDTHGHLCGDRLLRDVGTVLQGQLRPGDVIGRFGGEEFVVWLPGGTPRTAVAIAQRLRAAVGQVAIPLTDSEPPAGARTPAKGETVTQGETVTHGETVTQGETVAVTASVGVAVTLPRGEDLDRLVERADAALYAAKRAGRDQVRLYGEY